MIIERHTIIMLEHDIDVGDAKPIRQCFDRVSSQKCRMLEAEVEYMLKNMLNNLHFCDDYFKVITSQSLILCLCHTWGTVWIKCVLLILWLSLICWMGIGRSHSLHVHVKSLLSVLGCSSIQSWVSDLGMRWQRSQIWWAWLSHGWRGARSIWLMWWFTVTQWMRMFSGVGLCLIVCRGCAGMLVKEARADYDLVLFDCTSYKYIQMYVNQ